MNENQQNVINYIRGKGQEPLYWELKDDTFKDDTLKELSELNLNDLVLKTLYFTNHYDSYCVEDNSFETRNNRWRSSLDIWRHVKYFKPDITIFQVMNSLFEVQDHISGHYCDEIHRRVFRLKGGGILRSLLTRDEYYLVFSNWNNIDKEVNN